MPELLLLNSRLCTLRGDGTPRRGEALGDLSIIEKGWVLGYDNRHFTFGLSTVDTDDGDGMMIAMTLDCYEIWRRKRRRRRRSSDRDFKM